jgi:hypothetical protein
MNEGSFVFIRASIGGRIVLGASKFQNAPMQNLARNGRQRSPFQDASDQSSRPLDLANVDFTISRVEIILEELKKKSRGSGNTRDHRAHVAHFLFIYWPLRFNENCFTSV